MKSNVWAQLNWTGRLGLVVLCLYLMAAFGGYLILPDDSRHANRQTPEWAKLPPGSSRFALLIQPPDVSPGMLTRWWRGSDDRSFYLPLADAKSWRQNGQIISYTTPDGQTLTQKLDAWGRTPAQFKVSQRSFPAGTDTFGRDVWSRLLLGTRVSLGVGLGALLVGLVLGVGVGLTAGYFGGRIDAGLQWLMAVVWSVPTLLLAIALAFILGKGLWQLSLAIGATLWIELARVVRGQVLSLRERDFIHAARVLGFSHIRVLVRHLLPNLWGSIIILSCANFASAILLEAGLSFLGLGAQPPIPTWGGMIFDGFAYMMLDNGKWLAIFPGAAIVVLIISLNSLSIGLKNAFA